MNSSHTYRGRLQLEESQAIEVDLRVAGKEVILVSSAGSLGVWPLDDVGVVRVDSDKFLLDLGGEKAIFFANDVLAFSYEGVPALGTPTRLATRRRARRERRMAEPEPVAVSVPRPTSERPATVVWDRVRAAGARAVSVAKPTSERPASVARDRSRSAEARAVPVPKPTSERPALVDWDRIRTAGGKAARRGHSLLARTGQSAAASVREVAASLAEGRERRRETVGQSEPAPDSSDGPAQAATAAESVNGSRGIQLPDDLARKSGKAIFAGADLFRGRWPGPRILIYHQVGTDTGRQMEVTYDSFVAQLEWMMANGSIISLDEALRRRGGADADRLFVVTFDDGYSDLFDVAYPLLERYEVPFTLYLTTGHVESGVPLAAGRRPLTWDQVEAMVEGGRMTLGAHTRTHLDLCLASREQVEDELGTSNEQIKARTGVTPIHFTYPWGRWSPIADTVVRRHYTSATLGAGGPVTAQTDPFLVHRLPIQRSDGVFFFKRKALRGMPLEESARRMHPRLQGPLAP